MQSVEMVEFDEDERIMREASLAYHRQKKAHERLTADLAKAEAEIELKDKIIAELRLVQQQNTKLGEEVSDLRELLSVLRAHLDAYGVTPPAAAKPRFEPIEYARNGGDIDRV